jgi:malate dehydrogenase (oxaloacetate-decarboxylating)(NADP+)
VSEQLKSAALRYHCEPTPGKVAVAITKPCATQEDLSLAYTPGVAAPVHAIVEDPEAVYRYTSKGNLVAVVTDGSAVLGLGNVGPLAGKPVMEGKGVLFKKFAGIDVFDIEVQAESPEAFIETLVRIAPSFGGINLEDIASPACFAIEQALIERLDIPVFHDDQHGTAIILGAALLNALEVQGKTLQEVRIVCLGAGAAAIASMRLLLALGARKEQMLLVDRQGVIQASVRSGYARTNLGRCHAWCRCVYRFVWRQSAGLRFPFQHGGKARSVRPLEPGSGDPAERRARRARRPDHGDGPV